MWRNTKELRKKMWKHHKDSIPVYIGILVLILLVLLMYYLDTSL